MVATHPYVEFVHHSVSSVHCTLYGCHLPQVRLAAAVGQQRRMSRDAAALFTEGAPGEVVLPDCTALEPCALAAALQDCATPRCVISIHPLALLLFERSYGFQRPCQMGLPMSDVRTSRSLHQAVVRTARVSR